MSDALKSLKAQIAIQKQLKKQGLSTSKLNDMINNVNTQFKCDAECLDAREKQKLRKIYKSAENNLDTAPEQVDKAEKNYYVYAYGETAYDKHKFKQYTAEIDASSNQLIKDHLRTVKIIKEQIADYNNQKTYGTHMIELLKSYVIEHKKLVKNIKDLEANVNTNDRKVFYENEEVDTVNTWLKVIRILYWGAVIAAAAILIFHKKKHDAKTLFLIITFIIYPFVIDTIVKYILGIFIAIKNSMPKNVYTSL